jgi:hypothetical protein
MIKAQSSLINLTNFQNFIFHFLFIFILSSQIIVTNSYLNIFYILGLMIFIRAEYEYNWKLILLISFYGLYQDTLLGFQFGFSSLFFLFFFFLGQISNLVSGTGSFLMNVYFFVFGVFLLSILEGFFLFFSYSIVIDFYKVFINMILTIILFLFTKRFFNSFVSSNV